MKRELPAWSLVAVVIAVVALVALLYMKGASAGDASKDELTKIRMNQRSFSAGGPPAASGLAHK